MPWFKEPPKRTSAAPILQSYWLTPPDPVSLSSLRATIHVVLATTYSFQAVEYDNHFFVNPGSASGAWTGAVNGFVASMLSQTLDSAADSFL